MKVLIEHLHIFCGSRPSLPRLAKPWLSQSSSIGTNERYLSAASAWEIGIKNATGRLPLPGRPDVFIPNTRDSSGISSLHIDEESALLAGRLPGLHSDPFDRMLVAQAIVHGMTILTPDPLMGQYAVRVLW